MKQSNSDDFFYCKSKHMAKVVKFLMLAHYVHVQCTCIGKSEHIQVYGLQHGKQEDCENSSCSAEISIQNIQEVARVIPP